MTLNLEFDRPSQQYQVQQSRQHSLGDRCQGHNRGVFFPCQSVPQSLSFCSLTALSNLSTQTPGVLRACTQCWRAWGVNPPWKWWARGTELPHENLNQLLAPEKAKFQSSSACPFSRWPPFEHCSTPMGSLDMDPLYSTLCPSITSAWSASKFPPEHVSVQHAWWFHARQGLCTTPGSGNLVFHLVPMFHFTKHSLPTREFVPIAIGVPCVALIGIFLLEKTLPRMPQWRRGMERNRPTDI